MEKKSKAYVKKEALIEPYLSKYTKKSKYKSNLSKEELEKIRRVEEAYANKNRFSFLCNY